MGQRVDSTHLAAALCGALGWEVSRRLLHCCPARLVVDRRRKPPPSPPSPSRQRACGCCGYCGRSREAKRIIAQAKGLVGGAVAQTRDALLYVLVFVACVVIGLHMSDLVSFWPLYDRFWSNKIMVGAFARDVPRVFYGMVNRLEAMHRFTQRGFADRLNISLNTFLSQQPDSRASPGSGDSFELRTIDEVGLEEVLPDQGARSMLREAARWTDHRSEMKPFDPFISLSEVR
jgi:hypothetical protein